MGDVDDGRGGGGRRGGACACAEEGADDAVLCVCATEVVVEDGEQRGRVDRERCRAGSVAGVSGVGDGDDDLRVDIGAVLDEDRRRGRAQRHRRVQCSKATAELQSSLFFTHALRRDKRPFSPILAPPPLTNPTGTHPQGRRVQSRTLPFALRKTPLTAAQTVLHYGWIPMIIYFGYTRSSPQPMFIKSVSPSPPVPRSPFK